jgi:hypothetical protein
MKPGKFDGVVNMPMSKKKGLSYKSGVRPLGRGNMEDTERNYYL